MRPVKFDTVNAAVAGLRPLFAAATDPFMAAQTGQLKRSGKLQTAAS